MYLKTSKMSFSLALILHVLLFGTSFYKTKLAALQISCISGYEHEASG